MDNTEAVFYTKEDGTQWVSRHPADPQHSQHHFYRLGGFLLALVILGIIAVVISVISPLITMFTSQMALELMNNSQIANIFTAQEIVQMERSIEVFWYPPSLVCYILSTVIDIALIVVIFMRKNLYLQLLIAQTIVSLIGAFISALYIGGAIVGSTLTPFAATMIGSVTSAMFVLIPSVLVIVYFCVSKRVKVYFKSPREERQLV
jgi:hypothetical protein